jgi:hypothetical protein
MENTTSSVCMAKVFQNDGKFERKNLSQKNVLGVFVAKGFLVSSVRVGD